MTEPERGVERSSITEAKMVEILAAAQLAVTSGDTDPAFVVLYRHIEKTEGISLDAAIMAARQLWVTDPATKGRPLLIKRRVARRARPAPDAGQSWATLGLDVIRHPGLAAHLERFVADEDYPSLTDAVIDLVLFGLASRGRLVPVPTEEGGTKYKGVPAEERIERPPAPGTGAHVLRFPRRPIGEM